MVKIKTQNPEAIVLVYLIKTKNRKLFHLYMIIHQLHLKKLKYILIKPVIPQLFTEHWSDLELHIKKILRASELEREDIKKERDEWRNWASSCEINALVFIDESSAKTNMCRLYGRSARGERCYGTAPGAWKTTTMLSSIRLNGKTECLVFDGAVDKPMFSAYMEEVLLQSLNEGDIVIMDNLSVHKNSFDTSKFKSRNIEVKYLPAYSPDFNPIEKMWSKIKAKLKEYKARDQDSLLNAIRDAFNLVTASNAKGWFESCGYFQ